MALLTQLSFHHIYSVEAISVVTTNIVTAIVMTAIVMTSIVMTAIVLHFYLKLRTNLKLRTSYAPFHHLLATSSRT